ncbi:hypothetical protein SEA_BONAMASSA_1 [Mycobacterium phage Bonamassa]|uniref:Uncharacterized protein n=1 Tax=Mycobacterium phage Swirley TaxID=1527534 RepID=A0A076YPB4_9CAUD|nr:hypothetical protein AVV40_gp01 [Mycobacterium phage Swirley]AIK68867.1 hypothetical protein PBI_SWIRLEY_1 [Mycobacterium phage Swirley]UJQ86241.1 hypothetical protein SEA_BONAMASSA_1 [Mycobacterium phage Bonamassa]
MAFRARRTQIAAGMIISTVDVINIGCPSKATWHSDFADAFSVVENLLSDLLPMGRELLAAGR